MTQSAPSGFSSRGGLEPGAGEAVVVGEVGRTGPSRRRRASTLDVVGPQQLAAELEVVGRVGEDQVDGCGRQPLHPCDAVADQHLPLPQPAAVRHVRHSPESRALCASRFAASIKDLCRFVRLESERVPQPWLVTVAATTSIWTRISGWTRAATTSVVTAGGFFAGHRRRRTSARSGKSALRVR